MHVGNQAFYDCESLTDITFLNRSTTLGDEVFVCSEEDDNFVRALTSKRMIYAPADSFAEKYAKEFCIRFAVK